MDFNHWTYKRKLMALLTGALLFSLISYFIAVGDTVSLYRQNVVLRTKIDNAVNAPASMEQVERRLSAMNNSFSAYVLDTVESKDELLEVVSNFCHKNGIVLKEVPDNTITEEKDFQIITNKVVAEGAFIPLLKLIYELEHNATVARVSAAEFKTYQDYKNKKDVLSLTIYLQNIKVKSKNL